MESEAEKYEASKAENSIQDQDNPLTYTEVLFGSRLLLLGLHVAFYPPIESGV